MKKSKEYINNRSKEILDVIVPDILTVLNQGYKIAFGRFVNCLLEQKEGRYSIKVYPHGKKLNICPFDAYLVGKNVLPGISGGSIRCDYFPELLNLNPFEDEGLYDGIRLLQTKSAFKINTKEYTQSQLDSYFVGRKVAETLASLKGRL